MSVRLFVKGIFIRAQKNATEHDEQKHILKLQIPCPMIFVVAKEFSRAKKDRQLQDSNLCAQRACDG